MLDEALKVLEFQTGEVRKPYNFELCVNCLSSGICVKKNASNPFFPLKDYCEMSVRKKFWYPHCSFFSLKDNEYGFGKGCHFILEQIVSKKKYVLTHPKELDVIMDAVKNGNCCVFRGEDKTFTIRFYQKKFEDMDKFKCTDILFNDFKIIKENGFSKDRGFDKYDVKQLAEIIYFISTEACNSMKDIVSVLNVGKKWRKVKT